MNQKLAETLAGWRQNRDEDSPSIAALNTAERMFTNLKHDPRYIYAHDNGIHIQINRLSEVEIRDDGTATVVLFAETLDGVLTILPLQIAEVPA